MFDCEGVSIVNGAQTVGVIWEISRRGDSGVSRSTADVQARIISLENCPEDFGVDLTTAANTQNPIRHRDFAALDPEQHRLAHEMGLDQKRYAFKSGDPDPKREDGCNIEEATIALACSDPDIGLTVQAKREVGQLWQDIKKPPYTTLFNKNLTPTRMWKAVVVMRTVESELAIHAKQDILPRGELVAVHGNRFVLHRVFMDPLVKKCRDEGLSEAELNDAAKIATAITLERLARLIQEIYPKDYLANLFKNNQKNNDLNNRMENPEPTTDHSQWPLFPNDMDPKTEVEG